MKNIFLALTFLTAIYTTYGNNKIDLDKILNDTLTNGKKLGEGSFGIVYSDPTCKYVIKEAKDSDKLEEFISEGDINKILFKSIEQLDDQHFYQENVGFITKYFGKIEKEEKIYLIFERAQGDEFKKLLEIEQYLLPAYNKAYAKLQEEDNTNPSEGQIKEKIKKMSETELFQNASDLAKTYKSNAIKLLDKLDKINIKAINEQSFQARVKRNLLVQAQLADALAIEHDAGKVHLDVKPENTMVYIENKYSNNPIVTTKVIDHGVMVDLTNLKDTKRTSNGTGSPMYIAPEEINFAENPYYVEDKGVSPAADVYSHAISTLEALFGKTAFWAEYIDGKFPWKISEKRTNQILFKALEDKEFLIKQKNDGKLQAEYSDIQLKFLNQLFRDCLNPNPAERPSMAQVGELLEILLSYEESEENKMIELPFILGKHRTKDDVSNKRAKLMTYKSAKAMAELDRPKTIPMAIRNMIKNENDKIRKQGFEVLELLIKADPSYETTPSYGLAMLQHVHYKKHYTAWAKNEKNKAAVDFLKKYTYVNGKNIPENLPIAPIPVSQPIYDIIQKN